MGEVFAVISERLREAVGQRDIGTPAEDGLDFRPIRIVIPNIDPLSFLREITDMQFAAAIGIAQKFAECGKRDGFQTAKVEDFAIGRFGGRREQQCIHAVVDVGKIAELGAAPDFDGLVFEDLADPNAEEGLTGVFDAHARSVGVGEAEGAGLEPVNVVVEDVVPFPSHLVDAVDVDWTDGVQFVDGKVIGFAVELAGAGEEDFEGGVEFAAGLEQGELGAAVDFEVGVGVEHGVEVTGLPGEVEEEVLVLDEVGDCVGISDIGDVDAKVWGVCEVVEVEGVAAVFGNEAVDDGDLGACLEEGACEGGADEAEPARDED